MAQTDSKAGFRLPWSSDRQSVETSDSETTEQSGGWPADESATATDHLPAGEQVETAVPQAVDPWTGEPSPASPPSRPLREDRAPRRRLLLRRSPASSSPT